MVFQHELSKSFSVHKDRVAIERAGISISYAELAAQAECISGFFLDKELQPETPVGILLSDRINIIYAITGLAGARCVFVPLDRTLPAERLHAMIRQAGIQHIITDDEPVSGEWQQPENVVCHYIKEIAGKEDGNASPNNQPDYRGDDSLYIYYTSGSTGTPKGIVGRNSSLLQFLQWEIKQFGITPGYRFSQFISPYFDAFMRDILAPLLSGGTICIPPDEEDFFATEKITSWVDSAAITLIHCVPSIFRLINNHLLTSRHFGSLKYVLMSGERIVPAELIKWYQLFDQRIQLVNLYGATESTLIRSCYFIKPEDASKAKISIGKPIDDTELLVLNKQLKPCKLLETGDLFIVSDYLSKGYLNDPELTAAKFIQLGDDKGNVKRAYNTGDKARNLADGSIDLLGREDRQVKLRGIRIELEEIENKLLESGMVKQAVVMKHTDANGNESLAAFIIPAPGNTSSNPELLIAAYLQSALPEYMIPADIKVLEEFPLLTNGKINYKKLPELLISEKTEAPATETEQKLLGIWKEIIGEKNISVLDTFYKIGGNSLSIMRLLSFIYRDFSVKLPLSDIFMNPSIRQQALLIDASARHRAMKILPAPAKDHYHVSASQQRLYYNYELDKDSVEYNIPMAWKINESVTKEKIEEVFSKLISRHESLRTSFFMENGVLLQRVAANTEFSVETIFCGQGDVENNLPAAIRPFDLGTQPLVRACIIQNDAGERLLVIDVHHIVCDGISQAILRDEFIRLYNNGTLPPQGIQMKDYAEWEYQYRTGNEYLLHRQFWLRNFADDIPQLKLPTTQTGKAGVTGRGDELLLVIPKKDLSGLTELSSEKITLYSLFLSAYYVYLFQLTGQHDIVTGVVSSGRVQHELDNTVGMFVKTLPVRYRVNEQLSFEELATDLHAYLLEAYNNQVYDLADMVKEMGGRSTTNRELFSTVLAYNNFNETNTAVPDGSFEFCSTPAAIAKFPFYCVIEETESHFAFRFEYSLDYFTAADMKILTERFENLIIAIAANPHDKISSYISGSSAKQQPAAKEDIVFNF